MVTPEKCPVTRKHRQAAFHFHGHRILVDRGLKPLIEALFNLGIYTSASCEAHCGWGCENRHQRLPDTHEWDKYSKKQITVMNTRYSKACYEVAWMVFPRIVDARNFLNIVYSDSDPERLRDSMEGVGEKKSRRWIWSMKPSDTNDNRCMDHRGYWIGKRTGPPMFDFDCSLTFPRAHIELVTSRLQNSLTK